MSVRGAATVFVAGQIRGVLDHSSPNRAGETLPDKWRPLVYNRHVVGSTAAPKTLSPEAALHPSNAKVFDAQVVGFEIEETGDWLVGGEVYVTVNGKRSSATKDAKDGQRVEFEDAPKFELGRGQTSFNLALHDADVVFDDTLSRQTIQLDTQRLRNVRDQVERVAVPGGYVLLRITRRGVNRAQPGHAAVSNTTPVATTTSENFTSDPIAYARHLLATAMPYPGTYNTERGQGLSLVERMQNELRKVKRAIEAIDSQHPARAQLARAFAQRLQLLQSIQIVEQKKLWYAPWKRYIDCPVFTWTPVSPSDYAIR